MFCVLLVLYFKTTSLNSLKIMKNLRLLKIVISYYRGLSNSSLPMQECSFRKGFKWVSTDAWLTSDKKLREIINIYHNSEPCIIYCKFIYKYIHSVGMEGPLR